MPSACAVAAHPFYRTKTKRKLETMKLKQIAKSTAAMLALAVALGLSAARAADSNVPKTYPLKTCAVSGDKLGKHGKVVKVTAPDGTDVYLCCKDCVKDFKKDPEKYAKMVKEGAGKK